MFLTLAYPEIDPIALQIGPFAIRWYALSYITGLVLAWRYSRWLASRPTRPSQRLQPEAFDDFLLWGTLGVVLGGRLGYVIFYQLPYYLDHPLEALYLWRGGMSFHGGLIGVLVAIGLFARARAVHYFTVADIVGCGVPIGLFLGRIANFINGELWGRPSDLPWAMAFPGAGPEPRHPSQLYEAGMEGLLLFLVLFVLARRGWLQATGLLSGCFLIGYALSRIVAEFFREPDAHLGFLLGFTTMGQILSLPMLLAGIAIVLWARSRPPGTP